VHQPGHWLCADFLITSRLFREPYRRRVAPARLGHTNQEEALAHERT